MSAGFEVYEDAAGEWRWRLRGANGEIVATSEGYVTKRNARRGIDDLMTVVSDVFKAGGGSLVVSDLIEEES